ncbi:MAG: TolC family protein [Planctomycetota bacterium]
MLLSGLLILSPGCRTPEEFRGEADRVAYDTIGETQEALLGKREPFTIDRAEDLLRERLLLDQALPVSTPVSASSQYGVTFDPWPDETYLTDRPAAVPIVEGSVSGPIVLDLLDALQVGAANSRSYQSQKESVFEAALALDLERDEFRETWTGVVDTLFSADTGPGDPVLGLENADTLALSRRFQNGVEFTGLIALDLVRLFTQGGDGNYGLTVDSSISIPLGRGAAAFVVRDPLDQAEAATRFAIWTFERFKREFAVDVASSYLSVLQSANAVQNAADNYERVIRSTRRARRLADAGRLPEIQVDQAAQDELVARQGWISSQQNLASALDGFKLTLGLPVDAEVRLDQSDLDRLRDLPRLAGYLEGAPPGFGQEGEVPSADAEVVLTGPDPSDAGPLEIDERPAILIALANRLDLRVQIGQFARQQREVAVAADALQAEVTLLGRAALGEGRSLSTATLENASVRVDEGFYSALLSIDLPFERTSERNAYRRALIDFEGEARDIQALEDGIKQDIREALRTLLNAREGIRIQAESVNVARRRVDSTDLFLQAGRASIRDVLEAQEDLLSAENALTAALVDYRVAELELQRDLGVLEVDERGLWREIEPEALRNGDAQLSS